MSSTREQLAAAGTAGQSGARAVHWLSRAAVCKQRESDLHDLSHGRSEWKGEVVSAAAQF
jgi:hypothetical protein